MCFLLFANKVHPAYPLIVAGNRDEFYQRPTEAAHFWADQPQIIAGRDLQQGGTWMGMNRAGRIACLTNFRDGQPQKSLAPSRGELVVDFLNSELTEQQFTESLSRRRNEYNGFNIVFGSVSSLQHVSNRLAQSTGSCQTSPDRSLAETPLTQGVHGISNGGLNESWPKVVMGKSRLREILQQYRNKDYDVFAGPLLELLRDDSNASDELLPDTGVGIDRERILSPIFINTPEYGTRCSTVIAVRADGWVSFLERSYDVERVLISDAREEFQVPIPN